MAERSIDYMVVVAAAEGKWSVGRGSNHLRPLCDSGSTTRQGWSLPRLDTVFTVIENNKINLVGALVSTRVVA